LKESSAGYSLYQFQRTELNTYNNTASMQPSPAWKHKVVTHPQPDGKTKPVTCMQEELQASTSVTHNLWATSSCKYQQQDAGLTIPESPELRTAGTLAPLLRTNNNVIKEELSQLYSAPTTKCPKEPSTRSIAHSLDIQSFSNMEDFTNVSTSSSP
jgi:hypothetical protein